MKNKVTRYTAIVKENGDSFRSFNLRRVNEWCNQYEDNCLNQDESWQPHFEITEKELERESK